VRREHGGQSHGVKYVNRQNVCYFIGANGHSGASALERHLASSGGEVLIPFMRDPNRQRGGYGCNTLVHGADGPIDFRVMVNGGATSVTEIPCENPDVAGTRVQFITRDGLAMHATVILLSHVLNGLQPFAEMPPYILYRHMPQRSRAGSYIGITRQGWWMRWAQHVNAAERGSPYLWHQAIRSELEQERPFFKHEILECGLPFDEAMNLEEGWVRRHSLKPLGLNMIPGGFAGMRYLHMLGALHQRDYKRDMDDRAQIMWNFMQENAALKALWADPEWAANVICGHSGRLTLEQVRAVRELASRGHQADQILELVDARNIAQVRRLLRGDTYSRVA
jgi:hypothetical protein